MGLTDARVARTFGRGWPNGCYEKKLVHESFTCIVRKGHPAADQRLTIARYCALSHLLVAPRGTPGGIVDDKLAADGRSRRVAVAVPHFLVVPHIVAATDLIATLPTRVVDALASQRDLVKLPPPIALDGFDVAMVWHERNHHDPGQRWLRDQVVAIAAALA